LLGVLILLAGGSGWLLEWAASKWLVAMVALLLVGTSMLAQRQPA